MAKGLYIPIVGDASSYLRALRQAAAATNTFSRSVESSTRGGIAASGLFRSMGRNIAFASGAFLGGAGLVATMKSSIQAASDLNEQMSKTNVVFGDSAAAVEGWAKTATESMGLSERQALATASSFGALFKPIGLVGPQAAAQSEKLTQLGADLASFYNTDVQDALDAIRSGIVGESEPLRRYGVLLSETRVQQQAMAETGKRNAKELTNQEKATARIHLIFKDAAVAQGDFARTSGGLANQLRIAQANIDNLKVTIGQALLPTVSQIVKRFNEWMSNSKNQQRVLDDVKQVASVLTGVLGGLKHAFEILNDITGSTRNSLKVLLGIFLAYKSLKLVSSFANMATQLGLIGANAKTAAGEAGALRTSLMNLSTMGPIGIAVAITVTAFAVQPYVTRALNRIFEATGLRHRPTAGGRSRLVWRHGRLVWSGSGTPYERGQTRDPVGTVAGGTIAPSQDPFVHPRGGLTPDPLGLAGGAAGRGGPTGAQRYQWFQSMIGRMLTRAQYKTLEGQLATYKQVESLIRRRMAVTKDITRYRNLEDQLLSVLAQEKEARAALVERAIQGLQLGIDRAGLTKGLSDDIAALQKLNEYLKRRIKLDKNNLDLQQQQIAVQSQINALREQQRENRKEAAREAAERRREALSTRLFGILGFGPGGEPKIPNINQLRRQFAALKPLLAGAPARIQREAANIQKVLQEAFLPPDIRQKVREMLNAYFDELRKGTQGGTPRGFTYNRPGVGGRSLAFAAAGLNVGTVNVYNTHNIGDLENQLTKRQAGRAHNRRGAR